MPNLYKTENSLIAFARSVLYIMEENKEWSSDTLDQINDAAFIHGLATEDDEGHFKVKKGVIPDED